MMRCMVSVGPAPEMAGSTDQRAASPSWMPLTCSPGCKATSQTCSTAQTMDGCTEPNGKRTTPPAPATGRFTLCGALTWPPGVVTVPPAADQRLASSRARSSCGVSLGLVLEKYLSAASSPGAADTGTDRLTRAAPTTAAAAREKRVFMCRYLTRNGYCTRDQEKSRTKRVAGLARSCSSVVPSLVSA